jgi:uncharacterized membrane protein
MSTDRLEAFSDGVFAVAITVLVVSIAVPEVHAGGLQRALLNQWPSFASYFVSFLIIGIIWVNHHTVFQRIVRVDRTLLFLNLLLLVWVVLIPYPTNLLARYLASGGFDANVAAIAYSVTMFFMAVSFALIWAYAVRTEGLLDKRLDRAAARASVPRFAGGTLIYVITILVAAVNAVACLVLHALLALYYVFDQAAGPPDLTAQSNEADA